MRIGMFDSGIGGLSVLTACKKLIKNVDFLYLDDSEHAPYGNKSATEVRKISEKCTQLLIDSGCEIIVIACNTATAAAAAYLRSKYTLPILGIEPAVKPALAATSGKVLLLSTPLTAALRSYPRRVIVGSEPTLASDIEAAFGNPSELKALTEKTLSKYSGFEAVVTGCSHYAHLAPYINYPLYDGAEGLARLLKERVEKIKLENF